MIETRVFMAVCSGLTEPTTEVSAQVSRHRALVPHTVTTACA